MSYNGGDIVIKRFILVIAALITILSLNDFANAYEFINSRNKSKVNSMISDVYDVKEQYEDFAGSYSDGSNDPTLNYVTSDSYWWPVGSDETTERGGKIYAMGAPASTYISSGFGYRQDPFGRGGSGHGGIDIPNTTGEYGVTNIIASKSGIVVYPNTVDENQCQSDSSLSYCGGSYGNYIIIQHNDGNYTLYAHLYAGSILVKAGDNVEQGQVIAKMGSSGASTGAHVHFEVREGSNSITSRVDPLGYVDPSNPRPVAASVITGDSDKQTVCLSLKNSGYNDDAVVAILLNMNSESGIRSNNMENQYESRLGFSDETYTAAVDNGTYGNFVHDAVGYGLVQWTYYTRKQGLYNYVKSRNKSIADTSSQVEYFTKELTESYPSVNNYLKNVSYSAPEKTVYFCQEFERPAGSCYPRAESVPSMRTYVSNGCN